MPKGVIDPTRTPRCTAKKRGTDERCKKPAIKGGTVCRLHGGSAPQVQRSARERFNDLIDPMINITHKLAERAQKGELTAQEQIALVKFIADRTGFVPGQKIEHNGKTTWDVILKGVIKEVGTGDSVEEPYILDQFQPEQIEAPASTPTTDAMRYTPSIDDVLEAELVDEDPDPRDTARRKLPYIGPPEGTATTTTVRIGSAEPPHRPGYRR